MILYLGFHDSDNFFCTFAPMNRINWIDWAKCLATMTVVFCHLPQYGGSTYFRYLQACIISIFFFLSGYLKRDRGSMADNWGKYVWGLVVPYVAYNALMLPYWSVRYCLLQGGWPDASALARPVLGALLFEYGSDFSEPLNGTLWYLPVILLMHLVTDLCHRTRHEGLLLSAACALSVAGCFWYKYSVAHPTLPVMGLLQRLPYFCMGYALGRLGLLRGGAAPLRHAALCVGCLVASVVLFRWHVAAMPRFVLHVSLFYPVNVLFIFGVVYGCRLLQGWTPRWVVDVSVGTLVVVGLQWMVIGAVNFVVCRLSGLADVVYSWPEALLLTLLITALHYPVIVLFRHSVPTLLGRGR